MAQNALPPDQESEKLLYNGKVMPLFGHLRELRKALINSLVAIVILFCIAMFFANDIINLVKVPLLDVLPEGQRTIHFTGPMDVFVASLKVSLLVALVFGSPVWSYQFWRFLEPALYPKERRLILPFAGASILLFFAGIAFCYYVMLPMTLGFLIGLGLEVGTPLITINDYISLVTVLMMAFGIIFELPVVLILLAILDIIDAQILAKHRSAIIVLILIVAAVLTPPDPISQISMAIPMYILYELSILIIRLIKREKVEIHEQT